MKLDKISITLLMDLNEKYSTDLNEGISMAINSVKYGAISSLHKNRLITRNNKRLGHYFRTKKGSELVNSILNLTKLILEES